MNRIKFLVIVAALAVCSSASAQFSNANTRNNQRSSYSSGGFDGNGPEAGYKGFIEAGYTFGVGDLGEGRASILTSHGYQINPYIFAGVGSGVNYYTSAEAWSIPIFADIRGTFLNNSITPYIDFKIGYSVLDVEGFYLSPSLGCRFGFSNNTAFTIAIGYEMQKAEYVWSYGGYYGTSKENCGGLVLKVGFEF